MKDILKKFRPVKATYRGVGPCNAWEISVPGQFYLLFDTEEEARKVARALTLGYYAGREAGKGRCKE